tara:strand:- start:12548 stop:12958 length:411 start_codon:yes stop_codon:yes gene_type:complete
MTKKIKRFYYLFFMLSLSACALFLVMLALEDNIIYFYSPSELSEISTPSHNVRLGGLVKEDSIIKYDDRTIEFMITDNVGNIKVSYTGILPDLFRDGQGVIVEGKLIDESFKAYKIVAKHDENYMPKDVYDKLRYK